MATDCDDSLAKSDANAKGQILSVNSGNSIQNNFTYNTIGIPTSIQAIKGTSTLFNVAYRDIDSRGNIQNRHDFISLRESILHMTT